MTRKTTKPTDIVTLADLAPRRAIVGGSERRVFGATTQANADHAMRSRKTTKDLPTKKPVKGGRLGGNDNVTLVSNGRRRHGRTRGHSTRPRTLNPQADPMASKQDLPTKKTVKGGRLGGNDNVTLVRVGRRRHG